MPLIRHLEISRYRSTKDANDQLTRLAQASGWPDHVVSRFALSRSLQNKSKPTPVPSERKGKELRGETIFRSKNDADYLPWLAAMIAQHNGAEFKSEDEAIELVLAHWHRGLSLLCNDLDKKDGQFVEVVVSIARELHDAIAELTEASHGTRPTIAPFVSTINPIVVPIGTLPNQSEPFSVTLNDTQRFSNCHAAVSGMSGSGKTQLAKQMLGSVAQCCDDTTGIIFIDFAKGDVAEDRSFVEAIDGEVIHLPGDILPIGPFHLADYTNDAITLAAEEKREVYKNLFKSLGPKQQGRLAVAIRESYEDLSDDSEQAPDFAYLQDKLAQVYQRENLQPDSLSELLRQLNAYRLFWSRGETPPTSPLHTKRWIVDIHELGGLKEVTAFTLIEQLYREMRSLPESQIDERTGLRHIRCVLAIDEAQYYLKARNRFLQGIIREGRSKGFAVMLMCQSPDDFDQDDFDYTEQLQFTYMLQCKTEPRAVQRLLGVSREEAKRIATQLGKMEPLFGVGPTEAGKVQQFRVVPFFEEFA